MIKSQILNGKENELSSVLEKFNEVEIVKAEPYIDGSLIHLKINGHKMVLESSQRLIDPDSIVQGIVENKPLLDKICFR